MLSDVEAEGCRRLLRDMSASDVISLSDTVTKRQIKVTQKAEAVTAIVTYTEKATDLLRRRKVTRDLLFQYLVKNAVVIPVNSDKRQVIQAILKLWGSDTNQLDFMEVESDTSDHDIAGVKTENPRHDSGIQTNFQHRATESREAQTATGAFGSFPAAAGTSAIGTSQTDVHVPAGNQSQTNFPHSVHQSTSWSQSSIAYPSAVGTSHSVNLHATAGNQSQMNSFAVDQSTRCEPVAQGQFDPQSAGNPELQALGEKFADWFYKMLNSHSQSTADSPQDFGPHHFWDEVKFTVVDMFHNTEEYVGAQIVSQRLLSFVKDEQLLFSPNVSREGVIVKSSRHGLVMIMACGTIHRGNDVLGVFQQVFGIVKDPRFDSNWKVKVSKLMVKCEQVTAMPKLMNDAVSEIDALVPVN